MELIPCTDDDERLVIERQTDRIQDRFERYVFEKTKGKLRLISYQDDRGDTIYPPEIDDRIKEVVEERRGKEVEIAPIYGGSCPDCNHPVQSEVEVEEDEHGCNSPVNDEMNVKCVMCGEEKSVEIAKAGYTVANRY